MIGRRPADSVSVPDWDAMVGLVGAAHRGPEAWHYEALYVTPTRKAKVARLSIYLYIALNLVLSDMYGGDPNLEDLQALSLMLFPGFKKILVFGEDVLYDTLRAAAGLIDDDKMIVGYKGIQCTSVLLGLIMTNPRRDFKRLRNDFAREWSENEAELRELKVWNE
jgi:hypothetical protein